ncbi:hypothetical protein QWA68_013795 [Fusarium oxysporum]|nr:hypothetical protein QWA68_013795 [Fusarium oxysporum]
MTTSPTFTLIWINRDWSLDADDTPKSTIWDPKTGFGGNGSLNKTESIYNGRAIRKCLDDGPFKDLFPTYLTTNYDPQLPGSRME